MTGARDLDFVPDGERPPAPVWALLVAGAIALAVAADHYTEAGEQGERLQRQSERLQRQDGDGTAIRDKGNAKKSAVATRQEQREFPWHIVLTELEMAADSRIALLSLNTEAKSARSQLNAEARSIDDALAFVSRLHESPLVRASYLVAHEAKTSGSEPIVAFSIQVDWSVE